MKNDKIGKIFSIFLGVAYIPLSLFSWLFQMTSESTIDATNQLYITLIDIFCVISFIIPFLCAAGITVSVILRKKVTVFCRLSLKLSHLPYLYLT